MVNQNVNMIAKLVTLESTYTYTTRLVLRAGRTYFIPHSISSVSIITNGLDINNARFIKLYFLSIFVQLLGWDWNRILIFLRYYLDTRKSENPTCCPLRDSGSTTHPNVDILTFQHRIFHPYSTKKIDIHLLDLQRKKKFVFSCPAR